MSTDLVKVSLILNFNLLILRYCSDKRKINIRKSPILMVLSTSLEILRIDLSLRESFCNHRLIESLRLLASSRPVSFPS
jgi:hypothetical protein